MPIPKVGDKIRVSEIGANPAQQNAGDLGMITEVDSAKEFRITFNGKSDQSGFWYSYRLGTYFIPVNKKPTIII